MSVLPLQIFSTAQGQVLPCDKLMKLAKGVYRGERIPNSKGVNLICCSDYRIRKLNRDYRHKDKCTDVLSFPFSDGDFLGEVYISHRRAEVQARRFGFTFEEEFLRLFLHGLLHLAGYDHLVAHEREEMEMLECKYLKKLFITL